MENEIDLPSHASSPDEPGDRFRLVRDYIVLFLYFVVAILAIFGNLFVVWVIRKREKLRKSKTFLILTNMAISDILGGLAILLQFIFCNFRLIKSGEDSSSGRVFLRICGFTKSLQILSYYVSTYSMLFIAIDRYQQIKYISKERYLKPAKAIALSWMIGGLFILTTFFNQRLSIYFKSSTSLIGCEVAFVWFSGLGVRKARIILLILSQYLIPLSVTGALYFLVWKIIQQNSKESLTKLNQEQIMYKINSKKRTITMLVLIVLAFAISWAPVHLIHFFNFFIVPLTDTTCNSSTVYAFAYFLGISSCCYNPLIYYWSNSVFRDEALNLLAFKFGPSSGAQEENDIEFSEASETTVDDEKL